VKITRLSVVGLCFLLAGTAAKGQVDAKSTSDGVYTAPQAETGSKVYAQYCASCHGADLAGGEMAPGLVSGDFQSNWNTLTLDQLFDRIRNTMPQDRPQTLSSAEAASVLAYVLAKTGFPAGKSALPATRDELMLITYSTSKP
jgi:mono/diheme cytochrome c family protein